MSDTPYDVIGGAPRARLLARRFYALMAEHEPELLAVHALDADGKVSEATQERFERFLLEWLGGPDDYSSRHGHPRLRMRHQHVAVTSRLAEAWVRTMCRALDDVGIDGEMRAFLEERFRHVAFFLRNAPGGEDPAER
jgi:hemoglobin